MLCNLWYNAHTDYITQTCTDGMPDMWTNGVANAPEHNGAVAVLGNGVFSNKGVPGVFPTNEETTSQFAGIVSFKAIVPPNLNPGPAAACVCSVPAAPFGQGTGTIKYVQQVARAPHCCVCQNHTQWHVCVCVCVCV